MRYTDPLNCSGEVQAIVALAMRGPRAGGPGTCMTDGALFESSPGLLRSDLTTLAQLQVTPVSVSYHLCFTDI